MKRFLYLLVQFTWGLGQTAIGFLFFLIHITKPHRFYRCAIETQWNNKYAGLSLGPFIFVPREEGEYQKGARVHEYGHTFQSLMLGPLYAIVGVISVGWGSIIFPILKGTKKYKDIPYTACFVEYWASAPAKSSLVSVNTESAAPVAFSANKPSLINHMTLSNRHDG